MRALGICSLAILLTGAVLALDACGSSGHASRGLIVPAPAAAKTVSSAEAESLAKEAVARCKRVVANARLLPAAAKGELQPMCDKVLGLTSKEAQELRHVICNEVAIDSSQAEAVRERVRRTCESEAS